MEKNFDTPSRNNTERSAAIKKSRRYVAGFIIAASTIGITNAINEYNKTEKTIAPCTISEEYKGAVADNAIVPGSSLLLKISGINSDDLRGEGLESSCIKQTIDKVVDLNPELEGVASLEDLNSKAISGSEYAIPLEVTGHYK